MLCRRAGMVAKAERYFEEALKWDPSNLEVQGALSELRGSKEPARTGFGLFRKN